MVVNAYEKNGECTQGAIDKAIAIVTNNRGGIVKLKRNGTYVLRPREEHVFNLPSNVTIDGNGATLLIEDGTNTSSFTWDAVFYCENNSNIIIRNLNLDANGRNNPVVQHSKPSGPSRHNGLLSALRVNNVYIQNCTVSDSKGYGCLYLGYCDNVTVTNCRFYDIGVEHSNENIGDASVIMGVGNNWLIENNEMKNSYLSNCGTGLDLGCSHSIIKRNVIESFWAGMNLANNGVTECKNNTIDNNKFVNNGTAIYLWATTEPYIGSCHDNNIINNKIIWYPKSIWGVRGIDLSFFVYGKVYNIVLERNFFIANSQQSDHTTPFYEMAIHVGPAEKTYSGKPNYGGEVYSISIISNVVEGCSGPAFLIDSRVNDVVIKDNKLDNVSSGESEYSSKAAIVVTNLTGSKTHSPQKVTLSRNVVVGKGRNCKQFSFVKGSDVMIYDDNKF